MNKNILFIRYRKSESIDAGGEQGTNTNYNVLCQIFGKENVAVYNIHDKKISKLALLMKGSAILTNFLRGYYYGLSPKKVQSIVKLAKDYSYVFIDRSIFSVIAKALRDQHYEGKIITFFHNVESIYFKAKIGENKPWCPIVVNCVKRNEQQACKYSDVIIALNERDSEEIIKQYGRTPNALSPVVFKDNYNLGTYPSTTTRKVPVCLFLGTYFPMNVRGILWFVNEVLPHVDIKLQIVGKGMKAILPEIKDFSKIEVYSDVADLRPFIEDADCMLLPIFEGSGMKVKTCEALMYGKNIIGTTEAFEGYEVDFKKVGARCNKKEEFISAINNLCHNSIPRFNEYSRQIFIDNYSETNRKKIFETVFRM